MTKFLSPEVIEKVNKVASLQTLLLNISNENLDDVINRLTSTDLNIFQLLHNVMIVAEYRPFSIPNLVQLCSHIENIKPLLLRKLSNPKILNLEQIYFLSKCRDAGIIQDNEVIDSIEGKSYDEEIFKSCFFNNGESDLIPIDGESIEEAIRHDSISELEACFNENQYYQLDYRIRPSIQFGCHFLRNQPTLIQYAAFCSSFNVFKYLLEKGANIDLLDLNNRSLAQFAMAGGNKDIIELLKQKRVSFNGVMKFAVRFHRNDLFEFVDDDPIPLLHHCTASNNVSLVLNCIEHGLNVNQPDILNSNSPIEVAAFFNSLDCLEIFLNHRLVNVNAKNKDGQTALHIAASKDFIEFVHLLLDNELVQTRLSDIKGRMPIHVAAENGHVDIVQLFFEKVHMPINVRTDYGSTVLHLALNSGDLPMIKYLLGVEGIDIEARTLRDETPLHCAAQGQQSKAAYLLLAHNVDPNVKDADGWTPLHYATQNSDQETVEILLACEKTDINVRNNSGWTPLHLASKKGDFEIVQMLFEANGKKIDINLGDNAGWTALHFASKSGNPEIVDAILHYPGVNINIEDQAGWTPLHDAVKYQNHDVIRILLNNPQINVNAKTKSMWVPLHIAYLNHDQETKTMLEQKPGIIKDAKDSEGRTPEDLGNIPLFGSEEIDDSAPKLHYFNGC